MIGTNHNTNIFTLPDSRKLCFSEIGVADGCPVLYCHGFPSSRIEANLADSAARTLGVRIISVDRPGYGGSDFLVKRKISDWPQDISRLLDYLSIGEFYVLGVSGGGPYALSCGVFFGRRIKKLGIVCGLGPLHRPNYSASMRIPIAQFTAFARDFPMLANIFYSQIVSRVMCHFPGRAINIVSRLACDADKEILRQSYVRTTIISSIREAFRQGGKGPTWDFQLYTRDWEIDPADIDIPTTIWHGEQDKTVPIIMSETLSEQIAHSKLIRHSNDGHFSLPIGHMQEIIGELLT